MAGNEIERVKRLMTSYPNFANMPLGTLRTLINKTSALSSAPKDSTIEDVRDNGTLGMWVKDSEARDDAVILYLHGGGYAFGSPSSHRNLAAAISRAAEAKVFLLDYRLAPEHPFPAAVEDAVTAYRWLLRQGIPPNRIGIVGDSAGGGLAVTTLVSLRDRKEPLPMAGICISPWVDLTCSADTYHTNAHTDAMVKREDILRFASMYLGDMQPRTPLASPLFADLTDLPPLLIQVGSEEVLLGDSIGLDQRARKAGVDSTLEIWDDMLHVWHSYFPMLKEGREAIERIGDYFKTHLNSIN